TSAGDRFSPEAHPLPPHLCLYVRSSGARCNRARGVAPRTVGGSRTRCACWKACHPGHSDGRSVYCGVGPACPDLKKPPHPTRVGGGRASVERRARHQPPGWAWVKPRPWTRFRVASSRSGTALAYFEVDRVMASTIAVRPGSGNGRIDDAGYDCPDKTYV